MRIKTDYMGNDQLLPAYNVQVGVADEYIAVVDVNQYRSDMDCFIPLMNKFQNIYGFYPKYPVADAGYGSYNNYIFCEQHGMEKYMKFPMFLSAMPLSFMCASTLLLFRLCAPQSVCPITITCSTPSS